MSNNNNKLDLTVTTLLPAICLLAMSGCSNLGTAPETDTVTKQGVNLNLKANEGEDDGGFKNPRVHPGTPYNQGWWPDP
jgi:hypothetical protein